MKSRVLGIDPGKADTGWGVIEFEMTSGKCRSMKCVDYGVIKTTPGVEDAYRLKFIFNEMMSLCKKHEPEFLSVEKLFFFKNRTTAMGVAEARGVVLMAGAKKNLEVCGYTPLEIKMTVTGSGKATKIQVQEMVKRILKMEEIPKPDDAADALGAAICCIRDLENGGLKR